MDKRSSVSLVLFLVAVVIAAVTCFEDDDDNSFERDMGFGQGDYFNNRKFQNWLHKRGFGGRKSSLSFGGRLGDSGDLMNWRDLYQAPSSRLVRKRQLSNAPRSFGNFHNYFTNGLQDWRHTFNGMMQKRGAPDDRKDQHASQQQQQQQQQSAV